jgi:integrase
MARTSNKDRARQRILNDDELKAVWKATEGSTTPFHRLVRFILLTGARRSEAAEMAWNELIGADWVLPSSRNKTKVDLLRPLSPEALAVLPARKGKFVFSTDDGLTPISGFSKFRTAMEKASETSGWTIHDLRRTARTLMSRAKVPPDHGERCLGHVIPGVRGVYDLWEFRDEKLAAYKSLAALIERIIDPQANVTPLKRGA